MGLSGQQGESGRSMVPGTFQSLYEFELPEQKFQRETVGGMQVSYSGQQLTRYRGPVGSDWSAISTGSTMAPLMQLLLSLFPEPGLRNLGVTEAGYQLEVSDTMTRFLPKLPIPTRRVELGDLIPFLLLLFLLPDYKKLCRGQGMLGRGEGRHGRARRLAGAV